MTIYKYITKLLLIGITCTVLGGLYINLRTHFLSDAGSGGTSPMRIKLKQFAAVSAPGDTLTIVDGQARNRTCIGDKGKITYAAVPNFIIAGVQKSGTSALTRILSLHPNIMFGRGQKSLEGHYFDKAFRRGVLMVALYRPETRGNMSAAFSKERWCSIGFKYRQKIFTKPNRNPKNKKRKINKKKRKEKIQKYNHELSQKIIFEKTPSYMVYPHIPELIRIVCPWRPKIILFLRNPIDRAYSHFDMGGTHDMGVMDKTRKENYTFEETVESNMDTMEKMGILLEGGLPNPKWVAHEHQFNITQLIRNVVYRGFYATQLEFWLEHFPIGEKLMIVQYEKFNEDKKGVMDEILEFVGASQYDYTEDVLHQKYFHKNKTDIVRGVTDNMRNLLRKVYKPHNDRLADLLGEEWRDVWD